MPILEEAKPIEVSSLLLERLVTAVAKLETRMDETDRRWTENRAPLIPDLAPPFGQPDWPTTSAQQPPFVQMTYPHSVQHQYGQPTHVGRQLIVTRQPSRPNPNSGWAPQGPQPTLPPTQPHQPSCWDPPGLHIPPYGPPYEQPPQRQPSCWDPSGQRSVYGYQTQETTPRICMDPPRFDGSDAANWIFRVQYYFDHWMVPDTSRLHYVVMMFDPPTADWIFNYCASNNSVT